MTITNGSVSIEDGVKAKEEYAPARKVKVDIAFSVAENEDGNVILNAAGDLANSHVARLLGTTAVPVKAAKATKAAAASTGEPSDKEKLAIAAGVVEAPKTPAAKVETPKPADDGEEIDDLLGDTAPAPITDAELGKFAQEKNAKMKAENPTWAPATLRALITEFAGVGKKINDIPAARRHEFKQRMDALK